jgi:hypothetical protein
MNTKTKVWLVPAALLVVLLGVLGYDVISSRYSTQQLSHTEVQEYPEGGSGYIYVSDFLAGNDESRVASADLFVRSWDNVCTIVLELSHEEGTTLDEISLEFNPLQPCDALALETPEEYPSPLAKYQSTSDGHGVIYSIPDAGSVGKGTMHFEFLLRKDILSSVVSPADPICLHINFNMHRDGGLIVPKQHAEVDIHFKIP